MANRRRAAALALPLLVAVSCSLTTSLDDLKGGGSADGAPGAGGQAVVGGGGAWPDANPDTSVGGAGGVGVGATGGESSGGSSSGGASSGGASSGGTSSGGTSSGGTSAGGTSAGGTSSGGGGASSGGSGGGCSGGMADCNPSVPGCETSVLSDKNNCGACGATCSVACVSGSCCSKPCGGKCCTPLQKCCPDALVCVCSTCACPV